MYRNSFIVFVGAIFLACPSLFSQENEWLQKNNAEDKVQALKDTFAAMANQTDNSLFIQYCRWFPEIIEAQEPLSFYDNTVLSDTYDAFCLEPEIGNSRKFSSYLNRERPLIIAWKSPTDEVLSFAALRLPANWDPEQSYPLYIHLHGLASDTDFPIDFLTRYFLNAPNTSYAFEDGYLLLPWGRGNLWYQGISETDIWECKSALEKLVKVDPQREYLTGYSMGGYGSWSIASKSAGTWAALGVEAGALWYNNESLLNSGTIENLKNLPTYFVVGVQDGLFDVNNRAYNLLIDAGNENANFVSFTGGHDHLSRNDEFLYLWMQNFVNENYSSKEEILADAKMELLCYPNPFYESTRLCFRLDKPHHIVLSVYSLQGKKLTTLVNEMLSDGYHEFSFLPISADPGIYFCQLIMDGTPMVHKMLFKTK